MQFDAVKEADLMNNNGLALQFLALTIFPDLFIRSAAFAGNPSGKLPKPVVIMTPYLVTVIILYMMWYFFGMPYLKNRRRRKRFERRKRAISLR